MMDILSRLGGMGQAQQTVSQQLGTSPQQTESAIEAAVPLLLGALTRNATQPGGLDALANAVDQHDGSAIDQFQQGQVPDVQDGQRILGHVFGGQQSAAANAVSQRAGISPQLALQILSMLAPLVMAYLGRQKQGQGGGAGGMGDLGGILGSVLGGGGLGSVLGGILGGGQQAQPQQPQYQQPHYPSPQDSGLGGGAVIPGLPSQGAPGGLGDLGGMVGTLNSVLDRDGDGNALNDLIGMFGGRRS
ncbi:hypothetical protein HNQ07_000284 [Deinococcus metalli]|uniref:DUF937 domain-containing protein n=1 Tax=Deinococcus metalli TaxID=1141878 RepID=A0A7W8NNL8_9DEIO|nr:DUF937 domain-containing protein [Deinococcus metalli]MBB5374840.1 hypothetical protein [Deinococcus metalli]GHF33308.1 hypothetical protein GCM10017781_07580 [Deinococcus metalli]